MAITGKQFLIRRKFLKLLGADFQVFDENQRQILFAHLKAFKWKEDITLYSDESKTEAVIQIKARQIIDFSAAYDFFDSKTGMKIGAAKRKGWKSILRDEWIIMDVDDRELGTIKEDSTMMALLRRFITALIPQRFHVMINNVEVAHYRNNVNPFISKVQVVLLKEEPAFQPAFAIAMGILLCAIEGKQH
ncbi:MAG: hypothetical protein H3C64_14765 [Candidatus Kuenenia stuttgartiensis]|nr:hypothetical protein [Candidatus Kuenenia stuttgartiensis]MCZ2443606.1 hypothetical protein [Flavobacteriales bacterium]